MAHRALAIFSSMAPTPVTSSAVAPGAVIHQVPAQDPAEVGSHVGDAEVAIIDGNHNFDPVLAPNLRWVQTASAGVNLLLGKELWQSDVVICNASGIQVRSMAEWAFSVILAFRHQLPHLRERRNGVWVPPTVIPWVTWPGSPWA